jgi:2-oxoglutarate ferredoxin oxidoreductase subunit beta
MADLQLPRERTVVVTGIGCWGKADDYIDTHTLHGTHGRAVAFATGAKVARPELNVFALMGDGDGATIGGNHLVHGARRNVDITAIVANNHNYGMTGGQYSATTPRDSTTSTSRYGSPEPELNLCDVVTAAGGTFVARGTVYHAAQLRRLIRAAIQHRGFSFIEVVSLCSTYFGRYNWDRTNLEMMDWLKETAVPLSRFEQLSPEKQEQHIAIGKLNDRDDDDFGSRYDRIIARAQSQRGEA